VGWPTWLRGPRTALAALTVATFNLLWGVRPRSWEPYDVPAAVRELDADVVALQESWQPDGEQSVAARVASELGYECHEVVMSRGVVHPRPKVLRGGPEGREGDGNWCLALLTRLPVTHRVACGVPSNRLDKARRFVLVADVDVAGTTVTVAGTHFAHMERGSLRLRAPLAQILPTVNQPGVLLGDLNTWGVVSEWLMPGWRRAVRGATWPAHRPHSQIDHVLVTPPVEVVRGEVVRLVASDHLPVRAELDVS
jgi:endonuclease/exonuclease/phosphatase family metal-dependent hydrolase